MAATMDVPLRDEVCTGLKQEMARPGEILAIATPLPLERGECRDALRASLGCYGSSRPIPLLRGSRLMGVYDERIGLAPSFVKPVEGGNVPFSRTRTGSGGGRSASESGRTQPHGPEPATPSGG